MPGPIVSAGIPAAGEHDRDQVMQIMLDAAEQFPAKMEGMNGVVLLDDFGIKTTYYKVGVIVN